MIKRSTMRGIISRQTTLVILIVLAAVAVIAGVSSFLWFQTRPDAKSDVVYFDTSSFTFSHTKPVLQTPSANTNGNPPAGDFMTVAGKGGEVVTVRNFLNDSGVTLTGTSTSDGGYYLVAQPYPEGVTPVIGGEDASYEILYFPLDSSFLISILHEPIGEVRREAALDLAERLGLSSTELCAVVVQVGTPVWVNDFYGARSLGLPGCPGSIQMSGDAGS